MVRIGVSDLQVIDLEAGIGSNAASPSKTVVSSPQSPKKAIGPGAATTSASTSPGPSRPSSLKTNAPGSFSSGSSGVPSTRKSTLIAPEPSPPPAAPPVVNVAMAGTGAKRHVVKKAKFTKDKDESHATPVTQAASTSATTEGEEGGGEVAVSDVLSLRPFANPRQPVIPHTEPPPAPLPTTTRRLYHPLGIFTVNASRRDDRALRALEPMPLSPSAKPLHPTADDAASVFSAAFKPKGKIIDGGYKSDYKATGSQPVWVQVRFKHPQHVVVLRVECLQPPDSGTWRHQLQARTLNKASEGGQADNDSSKQPSPKAGPGGKKGGTTVLSQWVTIAQFVTNGPEKIEFALHRGNLDVTLLQERPVEGLRIETLDSTQPPGWQNMQVWADEEGYSSLPCYADCKAHLLSIANKFSAAALLQPLLNGKPGSKEAPVPGMETDDDLDAQAGGAVKAPSNTPLLCVTGAAWLMCVLYTGMLAVVAWVMGTSPKTAREGCPNDLTILGCSAAQSGNDGCGPVNALFNFLGTILLTESLLTLFRTTRTVKLFGRVSTVFRSKDFHEVARARGETVELLEELGFIYVGLAPEGGYLRGLSPTAYVIILFQACFGFHGGFRTEVCRTFYLTTHRLLGLLASALLLYYLTVGLLFILVFIVVMRRYLSQRIDLVTTLRDLKW